MLLGRELEAFETEYAASVGVKHCVGVNSGTAALHVGLEAMGIGPGDAVIAPAGEVATPVIPTVASEGPADVHAGTERPTNALGRTERGGQGDL